MAFDVYVGTMTRFYTENWENVAQRMAREQGMEYHIIRPGGEEGPKADAAEVKQAVAGWCEWLSSQLKSQGIGSLSWSEEDNSPYFTQRPGWDGYTALVVRAAYAEHPELKLPKNVPEDWSSNPAYEKSMSDDFKSKYNAILREQLWLPLDFPFVFHCPTIVSEELTWIGSTFALKSQLEELNKQLVQNPQPSATDSSTSWTTKFGSLFKKKEKHLTQDQNEEGDLIKASRVAIDMFYELANQACDNKLPILLSY